jgi:hypothetical protein
MNTTIPVALNREMRWVWFAKVREKRTDFLVALVG